MDRRPAVRYVPYINLAQCKGCHKGKPVARELCSRCLPPDHKRIRR